MSSNDRAIIESCPSQTEFLQMLDDQLSHARSQQIIGHLQGCLACQQFCESLVNELESSQHSTIIQSEQSLDQVNRIVELIKRRPPAGVDLRTTEAGDLPISATDLESLQSEYQLLRELGRGGQGLVYLARDVSLQRDVVIKFLSVRLETSRESEERFRREARALASVQSKHVVPIHCVSSLPSGRMFMVMEYVEGTTLRQLQQSKQPLAFPRIASLVQQVALGLSAAHEKRLIHRDIKPENILIQTSGSIARIVDFGLAFDLEDESRITLDGAIAGTPAYMSPEQVVDPHSVDYSTDVYSLGVVLYELLAGEVPFRGTPRMMLLRLIHEEPVAPSAYNDQIPKDLETICLRAMSKDRSKRFRSASQFAEETERFLLGQPIQSRPVGWAEHLWRRMKANPVTSALTGSIILLAVVLASVSTFYAVHLNLLNRRIAHQALVSNQQRDAALDTLGDLTVQLQRKFDDPEAYVEEIQQSTLEIALRGLEKMEGLAGQSAEGGLARAIALRRLGQTLSRLEKDEAAVECIKKSEFLLRDLLRADPSSRDVIVAFAETTIAGDECGVDFDSITRLAQIEEAINLCKRFGSLDRDVAITVAVLLTCQAEHRLRHDLINSAWDSLVKCEQVLSQHWDGSQLPTEIELRDAILNAEMCRITLKRIQHEDHTAMSSKLLNMVFAMPQTEQFDSCILETQLSLYEGLGLLSNTSQETQLGMWHESVEKLKSRLIRWAEANMEEYAIASESLALLASDRLDLGMDSAARDLLVLRASLAETRLIQSASDPFALMEGFDSNVALASIEIDAGTAQASRHTLDYCIDALKKFHQLANNSMVTPDEWYSLVDVLEMLLETFPKDKAEGRQLRPVLRPLVAKIGPWSDSANLSAQADPEDLTMCRDLAGEIMVMLNR